MVSRLHLRSGTAAALLWMVPTLAHAQATTIQETVGWIVTLAITAINLGIWIVFTMLIQLLDTSVFLSPEMQKVLNEVWQLARNLVNIAFAVILIGAAVYTVVTSKRELIAEHLKKFVLAVVLVNFSWFIPQVIIDVGNIAAATIFDIPSMLSQGPNALAPCKYRSAVRMNGNGITCTAIGNTNPAQYSCDCAAVIDARYFLSKAEAAQLPESQGWNHILGNTMLIRLTNLNNIQNAAPSSVVLNGLIINHARLMGLASVPPSAQNDEITALIMFLMKEAIVLILHVALFFPLAAMLLAFAIRIPVLWLTIAFMPFMVLKFVVPEQYVTDYPQKIWNYFLKAAFLPAIVGIPLTIGFIMVNAGQKVGLVDNLTQIQFPLTGSIGNFQELLWLVMVIGIIWVGVFETLGKMEIMGMGSQMIKGAGEMIGKTAARAPLSIPLIPGTNLSVLGMARAPKRFAAALEHEDTLSAAFESLGRGGGKGDMQKSAVENAKVGAKMDKLGEHMDKLAEAMTKGDAGTSDRNKAIESIKTDFKIDIRPDKASEDLKTYRAMLQKEGADDVKLTRIDKAISAIEKAETATKKTP